MKKSLKAILILSLMIVWTTIGWGQLSGTYYIDNTATGSNLFSNGGRYFTSFSESIDSLSSQGITSAVTFEVAGGQTFAENIQIDAPFSGVNAVDTVVFKYEGDNKPIIQPINPPPNSFFGALDIMNDGDYYITFEGLKINATNGAITYRRGIRLVWGADDITIRNCEVVDFSGEGIIVYFGGGGPTANGCENVIIERNEVYHENYNSSSTLDVFGIWVNGGDGTIIRNNKIHSLFSSETSITGIRTVSNSDTNGAEIYNNFISLGSGISSDIEIFGIHSRHDAPGDPVGIYYNSVYIEGTVSNSDNYTSAIRLVMGVSVDVKNNISFNSRSKTTGTEDHYAIFIPSTSFNYSGDYNDFYVSGNNLAYQGSLLSDLNAWQISTGHDANSISQDPKYVGQNDLHVLPTSPVANIGTPITGISTDIDGETRDLFNPDIGADEFPNNSAPTITSTAVTNATEDQPYSYQVTVTDPDYADTVTFSLSAAPDFITIDPVTGLITGTPVNSDVGDHPVTVDATDLISATGIQSFTLSVANENDAPTISDIADQETDEETATSAIAFTVGDIDNDPATLTLFGGSSNTAIVPVENIVFGGSGANRTVTVTPLLDQTGNVDITVTVSDGDLTANDSFTLTVNPINDAPVVSDIPNQTVDEGDAFTAINLNAFVNDVDNADGELTWNYTGNSQLTVNINSETNVAVVSIPTSEWNGNETITFTATDPDLETDSDSAAFTVTPVNDVPVISGQSGSLTTPEETALAITLGDLTVTDIDNTYPDR